MTVPQKINKEIRTKNIETPFHRKLLYYMVIKSALYWSPQQMNI